MTSIGVFGSAFNPPHAGHADAIRQALEQCDQVFIVPSARHAFGKEMAPINKRFILLQAFLSDYQFDNKKVKLQLIELVLAAGNNKKPIYTYDLMKALQERYPNASLKLIVGQDNAEPETWARFHRHEEILASWERIVVADKVPVRSSMIRQHIREQGGCLKTLASWVGEQNAHYIKDTGLYEEAIVG